MLRVHFFLIILLLKITFAFSQVGEPAYAEYLIDTARKYSIEDIIGSDTVLSKQPFDKLNFGYHDEVAWFKMKFDTLSERRFMVIYNAHIDSLFVYKENSNGRVEHYLTGDHLPFDSREYQFNLFIISIDPGTTIYLKAFTKGMLSLPVKVIDEKHLISSINSYNTSSYVYIGFSLIIVILITILYLRLRERDYLFYLLHVIAILFILCIDQGIVFQWLWPGHPGINGYNAAFYTFIFFSFLFSEKFLDLKNNSRFLYIVYLITYAICGITFLLGVLKIYSLGIQLAALLTILMPVLFIITGITTYTNTREQSAFYYMIGWSGYSIMLAVYLLGVFNLIPLSFLVHDSVQFGHGFEIIFLFLAVTDKIEHLKSEKAESDTMVVSLLKQQEETLKNQNKILEEKVAERTKQIEAKNAELKHTKGEIELQNEELMEQQEKLVTQRDLLEAQKEIIESQIRKLNDINDKLEQKVKERTEDLRKSNKELMLQNSQLEQYAFITAHNLRAPVTRLKGLIHLFEISARGNEYTDEMLNHINKAVIDMEEVLSDLNAILEIKNLAGSSRANVDLNKMMGKIEGRLDDKIKECEAVISLNLEIDTIYSVGAYLESIFYNLIYNALKYRAEERKPQIHVHSYQNSDHIVLEVSDNGVGIDMKLNKNKIFGLYQRFHDHIHGKGMGLFMVKNQVEALNGTIDIDSNVGVGTTFKITFPGN